MLKKIVSLCVVSTLLVSTVACGSPSKKTTSIYRSGNSLGDQISNNISRIVNDAERQIEMPTAYNNTYRTDEVVTRNMTNNTTNMTNKMTNNVNRLNPTTGKYTRNYNNRVATSVVDAKGYTDNMNKSYTTKYSDVLFDANGNRIIGSNQKTPADTVITNNDYQRKLRVDRQNNVYNTYGTNSVMNNRNVNNTYPDARVMNNNNAYDTTYRNDIVMNKHYTTGMTRVPSITTPMAVGNYTTGNYTTGAYTGVGNAGTMGVTDVSSTIIA